MLACQSHIVKVGCWSVLRWHRNISRTGSRANERSIFEIELERELNQSMMFQEVQKSNIQYTKNIGSRESQEFWIDRFGGFEFWQRDI